MGSSSWSDDFYHDRVVDKVSKGTPIFDYDADIKAGKVAPGAHPSLSPYKVNRESRDSDEHPESTAIGVMFDVTGSMSGVPRVLQTKLPQLMGLLLRKGYIKDPQVLFGAVGDNYSDTTPLQVGQFESGVEMDDDVTRIYLEGGGGGSYEESYNQALYFFARHTSIDCFEKRGKKGYLFLIGDEKPYPSVRRAEAETVMGDSNQADIDIGTIIKELQERYNVFFLIPSGTSHYNDPALRKCWSELLGGQNVIMLEDPAAVCESIGLAIGLLEGTANPDAMLDELKDAGVSKDLATTVATALDGLAKSTALVRAGTSSGSLPETKGRSTKTERL